MSNHRRNPEEILNMISKEDEKKNRGQLKIFFGYAAGVGKTYAMLKAAHNAKEQGVDVVCGYVEPHPRPQTWALVEGLECLPSLEIEYNSICLKEFDLDGAIKRKPKLILVDELAHTNGKGCRHTKRYQDIEELLKAGIDVYTTVNVQHVESLNDTVSAITGVTVKERIPDYVFDQADQVELVDIEPDDLINRLNQGDVYKKPQAAKALNNFFTVENLTALRELALRRCADRVNILTEKARKETNGSYHTGEHIMVCLSSAPSNSKIIRMAARMATAFKGSFTALFVETPDFETIGEENHKRLKEHMRLAQQLGANIEIVYGDDIAYQIAEFARLSNISKIVIGRSAATRKHLFSKPSLTERLINLAPGLDIHIIPDTKYTAERYRAAKAKHTTSNKTKLIYSLKSIGILASISIVAGVLDKIGVTEVNIITMYILGVLLTSVITSSRVYSIAASAISVFIFNFLFTEPRYSFRFYDSSYIVTFAVMFAAAIITGSLAVRLKNNARQSAQGAFRTRVLFETNQLLQKARDKDEIVNVTAGQIVKLLGKAVVVYLKEENGLSKPYIYPSEKGDFPKEYLSQNEKAVAEWVLINNKHAGATTDTLNNSSLLYYSIRINEDVYGVVGIAVEGTLLEAFESSILLSILGESALAMENEKNAQEKEKAAIQVKNEQLRSNLLRTISHDLRTPLTSISGNASNLMNYSDSFDNETKNRLYTDIYDDSMWLINLVENLLSVTKLEEGRVRLNMSTELLDDLISEALKHIDRRSKEHNIFVNHHEEFLMAKVDARLMVQVIINILDNGIKYTQKGSNIWIETFRKGEKAIIRISDDGPGISSESKEHIFEMFYTGTNKIADSRRSLGLGLSLCKSIVNVHQGEITVSDRAGGGTIFEITLNAEEAVLNE